MIQRFLPWALVVIALGTLFGGTWFIGSTAYRPLTLEIIWTAWSRVVFVVTFPLRLAATVVLGAQNMRHAHGVLLGIAFVTPGFWMLMGVAIRRLLRGLPSALTQGRSDAPTPLGNEHSRLDRRTFLFGTGSAVVLAGSAAAGDALLFAPQRVVVRSYNHLVPWLPQSRDRLRIVHVSDTHLGPYVSRRFLQRVMTQVNALQPDLVALTGDYVHRHPSFIEDAIGLFGMLEPRIGTVAVLGNHDHWEGADACRVLFDRLGIPLLDNGRRFLGEEGFSETLPRNRGICIAGLGDLWEDDVDSEKALRGVPDDMHRIVLSHNPDTALLPKRHRIDLMLSGHTHGGQVHLPGFGAPFAPTRHGNRFLGGACWGDGFPVIVSRGLGLAGVPVRFGVPPEIGVVDLYRRGDPRQFRFDIPLQ